MPYIIYANIESLIDGCANDPENSTKKTTKIGPHIFCGYSI